MSERKTSPPQCYAGTIVCVVGESAAVFWAVEDSGTPVTGPKLWPPLAVSKPLQGLVSEAIGFDLERVPHDAADEVVVRCPRP